MFETFRRNYPRDPSEGEGVFVKQMAFPVPGLNEFFGQFAGASFKGGLYRVMQPAEIGAWRERIALAFPEFAERLFCFGYDWLGSVFALDTARLEGGQPGVVMFEPGTGEALEIPSNIVSFHDAGLMEFGEAALAISFYHEWISAGGVAPNYAQCVGYKKPLFLGGRDEVENLALSDLSVYWHLMGQLISKSRGLPPGTPVRVGLA